MGASDRDMQRGTTLVFGIDSSESLGSLGKGTKSKKTHTLFWSSKIELASKRPSPKSRPSPKASTPTRRKNPSCFPNVFCYVLYVFLAWKFFKCEEILFSDFCLTFGSKKYSVKWERHRREGEIDKSERCEWLRISWSSLDLSTRTLSNIKNLI